LTNYINISNPQRSAAAHSKVQLYFNHYCCCPGDDNTLYSNVMDLREVSTRFGILYELRTFQAGRIYSLEHLGRVRFQYSLSVAPYQQSIQYPKPSAISHSQEILTLLHRYPTSNPHHSQAQSPSGGPPRHTTRPKLYCPLRTTTPIATCIHICRRLHMQRSEPDA
jgi:hypothetical protein